MGAVMRSLLRWLQGYRDGFGSFLEAADRRFYDWAMEPRYRDLGYLQERMERLSRLV